MPSDTSVALNSIQRGHVYQLDVFKRITGLGTWAIRTARWEGLHTYRAGGRARLAEVAAGLQQRGWLAPAESSPEAPYAG